MDLSECRSEEVKVSFGAQCICCAYHKVRKCKYGKMFFAHLEINVLKLDMNFDVYCYIC